MLTFEGHAANVAQFLKMLDPEFGCAVCVDLGDRHSNQFFAGIFQTIAGRLICVDHCPIVSDRKHCLSRSFNSELSDSKRLIRPSDDSIAARNTHSRLLSLSTRLRVICPEAVAVILIKSGGEPDACFDFSLGSGGEARSDCLLSGRSYQAFEIELVIICQILNRAFIGGTSERIRP
jgi:hypothetical protein